jgi:hypothetical protein
MRSGPTFEKVGPRFSLSVWPIATNHGDVLRLPREMAV